MDQLPPSPPVESEHATQMKLKILYTRDFLLRFSQLDICKKLPSGFDASILSEFEDASSSTLELQRNLGGSSSQNPKHINYGWLSTNRSESSSSLSRGSTGRWDTRFSGSSDRDGDMQSDRESFTQEMESLQSGIGSKSKPCSRFFSTAGCPFGEGCYFTHFVLGGIKAAAQMVNLGNPIPAPTSRNPMAPAGIPDGSPAPFVKTRMCNKYNTAEGCKLGDKCHFAHGELELGRPILSSHDDPAQPPFAGRLAGRHEQPQPTGPGAAASFGASATAKISVDASFKGAIIGKGGSNIKQICRMTGATILFEEHESDPKLKNIELKGTFDQIKQASAMVREVILNVSATMSASNPVGGQGNNYKTRLCDYFAKGFCTHGDRCRFAHGESELRKSAA